MSNLCLILLIKSSKETLITEVQQDFNVWFRPYFLIQDWCQNQIFLIDEYCTFQDHIYTYYSNDMYE